MKTKIMVSVNGSKDFHSIVPQLQSLLDRGFAGKVILVRVVPFTPEVVLDYLLDRAEVLAADARRREEADVILHEIAENISWGLTEHETVVLQGNEAETLSRFAASENFDLVLLESPEKSWLTRLVSGNLAERILNAVCVPVTLMPGPECIPHHG